LIQSGKSTPRTKDNTQENKGFFGMKR